LAERYGADRLDAACRRALDFDLLDVYRIQHILEQGLEWGGTPKIKLTADSLRSGRRQGAMPAARRYARAELRVLDCALASASVLIMGSWRSPPLSNETLKNVDHCQGGGKLLET